MREEVTELRVLHWIPYNFAFEFWLFYMAFVPHAVWVTVVGLTPSAKHTQLAQDSYHFLTGVYRWLIRLRKGRELVHNVTNIIKRPDHFTAVSSRELIIAKSVYGPQWTSGGTSSADGDLNRTLRYVMWCWNRFSHESIVFSQYKRKWTTKNSTSRCKLVAWEKLHRSLI